jgi:hypothetical protein
MKKIILVMLATINILAWEINTHRAIDKIAIQKSQNLTSFLNASGIKNHIFKEDAINFEGYKKTYIEYILYGEKNGLSQWNQKFSYDQKYSYRKKATVPDLLEAGTILEDAQWPHTVYFDGRFANHFYDAQFSGSGSKGLVYKGIRFLSADLWALRGIDTVNRHNLYSYTNALEYFEKGFTESDPKVRKKYQAKMLVSVGHLMHMVNDMKEEV